MSDDMRASSDYEGLDELVFSVWPAAWPGQSLVELDNVGDPGAWLKDFIGEPLAEIVLNHAYDDAAIATELAEQYLSEIRGQGFPLPSDFGDDPYYDGWSEEDFESVQSEFVAFLEHWREEARQAVDK